MGDTHGIIFHIHKYFGYPFQIIVVRIFQKYFPKLIMEIYIQLNRKTRLQEFIGLKKVEIDHETS